MLLSDLSRYTPESHPDSTALRTAVQKIRETAAFIDAERGKFEKLQKLSEIMRALGGKVEGLFVTGRTCVAEADVKLSGDREGYAWLFNDSIIAAEKKSGLLRSATLQLKLFVLFKDALFGTSGNVGIYVKCKDKDECVMAFSNPDERNVWLTLCNKGQ